MTRVFHPILLFLAGQDVKQRAAQVAHLRSETEAMGKRPRPARRIPSSNKGACHREPASGGGYGYLANAAP
jgi:hypothetical protein